MFQLHSEFNEITGMSLWGEEKNFWASMLIQAIQDVGKKRRYDGKEYSKAYKDNNRVRNSAIATAESWINSKDEDVMSFIWVCWVLGLEPSRVREEIKKFESGKRRRKLQFTEMGPLQRQEHSKRGRRSVYDDSI